MGTSVASSPERFASWLEEASDLPPGWRAVLCEDGVNKGLCYYADELKKVCQWEQPKCLEMSWTREVDTSGRAFWICEGRAPQRWFYELDPSSGWERLVDRRGRV